LQLATTTPVNLIRFSEAIRGYVGKTGISYSIHGIDGDAF
jgi:hypothetical protein